MILLQWMNSIFLKMDWLSSAVQYIIEDILTLNMNTKIGQSLHFFLFDTLKIFLLLSVLIYIISYIQSFFPPERTRKILGRFRGITANLLAALLGTITPFCSCSSIPLFIGFTNAGLPIGVTFSFLISSPLVDLASILLLASIFNGRIAFAYALVGIVLAVIGGSLISWLKLEKYVEPFVFKNTGTELHSDIMTPQERRTFAKTQVLDIIQKVWLYILIGVAIGAIIHNWIPESIINAALGQDKWYSVPLATFVGIPMYADIFGALPIAESLVAKGVGIGTVLSFMMAVTALSLPSLIMLKKVVKTKLLIIFTLIVTVGILIIGYTFNTFSYLFL